jgi:hypothetical protein
MYGKDRKERLPEVWAYLPPGNRIKKFHYILRQAGPKKNNLSGLVNGFFKKIFRQAFQY